MAYDTSQGISAAASGASAGAAIGGPVGAGIGGAIGLASGFFGNDEGPNERQKQLLKMLRERYNTAKQQGPTDTTFFTAGMSQAQERAREQSDRDASQAAARGLGGSQLEVALDQNRADQLGQTSRQVLTQSAKMNRQRERSALRALLQQSQAVSGAKRRRRQRQGQSASQAVAGFGQTFAGREEGPPLEDDLNNLFGIGGEGGGGK